MKQNFRRILTCLALAGISFVRVSAYDWVPVGDSVDANGFALSGGTYLSDDYVAVDAPVSTRNRDFMASVSDNTLDVYGSLYDGNPSEGGVQVLDGENPIPCTLKVNGNVVLDATESDMVVNINEPVIIEPYHIPPASGNPVMPESDCVPQIYFNAGEGYTINVNVDYDLEFRGKTTESSYKDLILTFAGRGVVNFNMADGTSIKFNGQPDVSSPQVLDPETGLFTTCPEASVLAGGTKVFVLMDQTADDFANGANKVVFQRTALDNETNYQRVLIEVGPNSVFTYLSTNPTGLPSENYTDGYGAVSFDPSNLGFGPMVLFIRGAYLVDTDEYIGEDLNPNFNAVIERYLFNDGAVVVAGHYVPDFSPETISGCLGYGETTYPGYDFSKPAGIRATMRVTDEQIYNASNTETYAPTADERRGLLVVNDVINHGKLAADPYWDLYEYPDEGYVGVNWAYSNPNNALINVRKGFIIGVNGTLDVYHNCFVDHVSGGTNIVDPLAECDYGLLEYDGDPGLLKMRNPSALLIDGLDPALFYSGNPFILDELDQPISSEFEAANPFTQTWPSVAQIQLRGTGTVYTRCSASTPYGYMYGFWGSYDDPVNDPELDWVWALSLGVGTYDGYQLSANDDTVQSGEGEHVLDVEGQLEVDSIANNTALDRATLLPRAYTDIIFGAGVLNAACILLDNTGREVLPTDIGYDLFSRPLLADGTEYTRYNSPTLFFNNHAAIYDSTLRHSDATKYIDGIPSLSEPGITGGERLYYSVAFWYDTPENRVSDVDRFRLPEIQLYNSTLELQESLNASGVRFVVKDIPDYWDLSGNNDSSVMFFDHGDPLDTKLTGFGRIFLCGSSLNNMYDGSNNFATESCIFNVFKNNTANFNGATLNTMSRPTLWLENGNQFHPAVQAVIDTVPSLREKQRAHHLFLFAQAPELENYQPDGRTPSCNMVIGWSSNNKIQDTVAGVDAPAADGAYYPYSYPYPNEPLVTDTDVFVTDPFLPDALTVPPATVVNYASVMCFGSFDQFGKSLLIPVATDNDDGVIYVKHGGKISTSRPEGTDITSIPFQAIFSTMLAQRVWNDYDTNGTDRVVRLSGIIDLPHDQAVFDTNYGVQPYNFTNEMFAARRFGETGTSGYVRLSYENEERTPVRDRSGGDEVFFGWFYNDAANVGVGAILPKTLRQPAVSETLQWLTRATESVNQPVERPIDLIYVGPGDDIDQIKVCGATMSDPFALDVSGDGVRPVSARVREFVSVKTTRDQLSDHFISEGAHAVLFVEYGGHIGLGARNWDEHSLNAWNLLGKDFVTICPLGDGTVDLNNNLLVVDRLAIIPCTKFGNEAVHRLTFFAEHPYEIRIPAGGELDLSGFGKGDFRQEIAFGGKVKLVVEEGATIRLPDNPTGKGLVLYFNDDSQLIFEGAKDVFLPFTDAVNNIYGSKANAPSANSRVRFLGQGQIWLNKNAQMNINGPVYIGVETDDLTNATDLTISLQRQSQMYIGTETLSGGAFQVGNPTDRGTGHTVDFTLALNGPRALVHIDREGFLGFGAGVLNKNGKPNGGALEGNPVVAADGTAQTQVIGGVTVPVFTGSVLDNTDPTTGQWQVQRLYNVSSVTVQNTQGIIEHKNIFDGTSNQASLLAIGPSAQYVYSINGVGNATVRGGGNIMYVPETATALQPIPVNIWDYAGPLATGERYSLFVSGPLVVDRSNEAAFGAVNYGINGKGYTFATALEMFNVMSFKPLSTQASKKIVLGETQFATSAGFANITSRYAAVTDGAQVYRIPAPASVGGGNISDALNIGALIATTDAAGNPTNYTIVK